MEIEYEKIYPTILSKLFPEQELKDRAESIMSEYGTERFHREIFRVKVAILKVAGSNLEEITRATDIACCDYRDIMCMTEYPNQSGKWRLKEKNPQKYKKLVQKDSDQYEIWINEMTNV